MVVKSLQLEIHDFAFKNITRRLMHTYLNSNAELSKLILIESTYFVLLLEYFPVLFYITFQNLRFFSYIDFAFIQILIGFSLKRRSP